MVSLPATRVFYRTMGETDADWIEVFGDIDPADGSEIEVITVGSSGIASIIADTNVVSGAVSNFNVGYGTAINVNTASSFTGTNLTFSFVNSPDYLSINSAGLITGTAPLVDTTDSITVRASNSTGYQDITFDIITTSVPLTVTFISPIATAASYASKIKDAFGFDRVIQAYSGNAARLIKAPYGVGDEQNFGFDADGRLGIAAVHTWRSGVDVKVVHLFSQKLSGFTLFAQGDVFFIKDGDVTYNTMGYDYEYGVGANGFKGNNVLNGKGAHCATLEGGGHLRTGATDYDMSAGMEMFVLFSPTTTRIRKIDNETVIAVDVTTTNGSNTVTVADTSSMKTGFWIHGGTPNIQEFSQIETIVNGTTLELTQDCRATGTVAVDFMEFNHPATGALEENIAEYRVGNNMVNTIFDDSSNGAVKTTCKPDSGSGETQWIGAVYKANAPRVLNVRVGLDDYGTRIRDHIEVTETFSPTVRTEVEGGSFDNGQLIVGARMLSSDMTNINTSKRANMKFAAVIITEEMTSEESVALRFWLELMAVNHLTMTDTENDDAYEELFIWKDATQDAMTGIGTLVGRKGQSTITIDNASFQYNYNRDGLRGLHVPAADSAAIWRANNTFGMDNGTGSWLVMYNNDVGGGTIASVLTMTSAYDGSAGNTNVALMIGPEHSTPTVLTLAPTPLNIDGIGARRFISDGVGIGVAVSPDNLFEYDYRTNNRASNYGSTVDYGGARGVIKWNRDTIAGTAPAQPADHILDFPVVTEPNAENISMGKGGFFTHMAVYKAPAAFDRTDTYENNKPHMVGGDSYSYLSKSGLLATDLGSVAEKRAWSPVVYMEDDSRLSAPVGRRFWGTHIAIMRPAVGRGMDLADCMKLSANAFRHVI